jgi:protein required for attachment to host cells
MRDPVACSVQPFLNDKNGGLAMTPATHWVLVADSASAVIYTADERLEAFEPIAHLDHPASRLASRDLVTDDRGRTRAFPGGPQSATEPHHTPHQNEVHVFAHALAVRLRKGVDERAFERIVLVAPPALLGQLRLELDVHTSDRVVASIPHDYTRAKVHELPALIRRQLGERPVEHWTPRDEG